MVFVIPRDVRRAYAKLASFYVVALFMLATIAQSAWAETADVARVTPEAARMNPAMEASIDQVVARKIEEGDLPGCVVVVGRKAGIVFEKAYGNRRCEPTQTPMTLDTLFDLASLTKPIATATSVMKLVERGKLRLQDKVAKFFPDFAKHGKEDVTIEQLLIHSSGLIPDNSIDDYNDGWASAAPKIFALEPLAPPGTKFKYSDVGYILLGKIVEQVTGKTVAEFASDEIYQPLGMTETGYLPQGQLRERAAPNEKRDGKWMTGDVHDPRAWLMGGVAGHAGLFSTADDLAKFAQTMLGDGKRGDVRILGSATVREMTRARNIDGERRGLGWDMLSAYSRNRGESMSRRAFGHGGFTGTAIWIDPELDLFVIFLSNRLHPDGVGEVNDLAGRIGTIAAGAIEGLSKHADKPSTKIRRTKSPSVGKRRNGEQAPDVKLGIDVLQADGFKLLVGKRVGLITNHTGLNRDGVSTVHLLHQAEGVDLVALFSPEHGFQGKLDEDGIADSKHEETGVPIFSLYGATRKPTPEQLAQLDVLVFDIQDVGARFYTYTSTMGLAMEAAAEAGKEFVVLDRPNPINGVAIEGPLLDDGKESFVAYHSIPVRHGMTHGELATMFAAEKKLDVKLTVVEMEGWKRGDYLFDTGLTWVNPSPNMRSLPAALLYPGIGLLETTNISVGRGTDAPFEAIGAPWINGRELARRVNQANSPGVRVVATNFTPTSSKFAGEPCGGISFVITDWNAFQSFEFGLVVANAIQELYGQKWDSKDYIRLLGNQGVLNQIVAGAEVDQIMSSVQRDVDEFRQRRERFELYQ